MLVEAVDESEADAQGEQLSRLSLSSSRHQPSSASSTTTTALPTPVSANPQRTMPIRVKVRYHDDLFVIAVDSGIDYQSLMSKVERKVRLCGGKMDDATGFKLKWLDEDSDLVDVMQTEDVITMLDWAKVQRDACVELVVI